MLYNKIKGVSYNYQILIITYTFENYLVKFKPFMSRIYYFVAQIEHALSTHQIGEPTMWYDWQPLDNHTTNYVALRWLHFVTDLN